MPARLDHSRVFVSPRQGTAQGQRVRAFNTQWRTAARKAGYAGVLLHDFAAPGFGQMMGSGTPDSICMKIRGHSTDAVFWICAKRQHGGHNLGTISERRW